VPWRRGIGLMGQLDLFFFSFFELETRFPLTGTPSNIAGYQVIKKFRNTVQPVSYVLKISRVDGLLLTQSAMC
jgi:hypothetical protein